MSAPSNFENRLDDLRERAWKDGVVGGRGVDVAGGPIPRKPGYYGEPVVRPPVWTWEIPLYFFIGGLSGMSAVVASAAMAFHQGDLARVAIWISAIGALLSPILLIMDLGRPRLFLNMLRVFKYQSAMSVGVWILVLFSGCVFPTLIALELDHAQIISGALAPFLRIVAGVFVCGAALFGMLLSTYTGVLIGATAIPAWFLHRIHLPIHFGIAGLGSAAGLLELLGYRLAPLYALGIFAAAVESALFVWSMLDRHGAADRAVHNGASGWLIRSSEILSGPLALVLRLFSLIPLAAISFLIGAIVSRFAWIAAGKASGCDPESVFAAERE